MDEKEKGEPPDAMRDEDFPQPKPNENLGKPVGFKERERRRLENAGLSVMSSGDFSHNFLEKFSSGKVVESGSCPTNVDCDWGTYDTYHYRVVYESLDEYIEKKGRKKRRSK